jgi:hypothetical protein
LHRLARIQWQLGDNAAAQAYAHESVGVARIFGHPFHEAQALRLEAMCWMELGHTKQSLALCNMARELLPLCGISGGYLEHAIMTTQATVHHIKTEFVEARVIHSQILQVVSEQQDFYSHVPKEDVKKNIDCHFNVCFCRIHTGCSQYAKLLWLNFLYGKGI